VRMIEGRGGVCFLDKPAAAILVGDAIGRQNLDRDLTIKPWIAGAIHLAHPASANQRDDFVWTERRAWLERHLYPRHYRSPRAD
jgi:hypothetical protein